MEKTRIQDDLYQFVNGEWLDKAVIPDDRPTTGGFADLDQGVEKLLIADFNKFAKGEEEIPSKEMAEAVAYYKKFTDVYRRNEEGSYPVLATLARIRDIKTMKELLWKTKEIISVGLPLPFNFGVEPDMKDATKYSFSVSGPSTILPDVPYYDEDNETGKALLKVYSEMVAKLLAETPLSDEEQERYLADCLAFDKEVAKHVKTSEEWADYVDSYHPMPLEEVEGYLQPFPFKAFLKEIYGEKIPETIVVNDPRAIKEFKEYFNEERFDLYIHWLYIKCLTLASAFLTEEMAETGRMFRKALFGISASPSLEKQAYRMTGDIFSEPLGVYYGRKYFGEEAKADVVEMVKKIINKYKERMAANTFLKPATKEKAILKLSTIEIKMGYPDSMDPVYAKIHVDEYKSLLDVTIDATRLKVMDSLMKLWEPVDKSKWLMPGHMVNACYNPFANDITFPAAILQAPFYSIKQSKEENLGGIGAVIGHEISHAFDNNGAQFDENGSLNSWWSKEDYAAFQKLTDDMIKQFDGIEIHGGKVNGKLTVSENIADNGGMGVTLGVMKDMPKADYKKYFINWAKIWCMKGRLPYLQYLLQNDVHGPVVLRANMTPRNFPEWYETFGANEKDAMYLPEDKRISIW
ncbi:MAG: M13 family metallopeptidase [Bacilli bacterium]|nr:M13 family metallopeptidase [Bacilli bacterium]